jgi:hypothetical protein
MHKLILALHLLFVIFTVGPLVHAATTASRGVRQGDGSAIKASARTVQIYAGASVLAVIAGMGLVQKKWHAEFTDLWVWLSVALWVVAIATVLTVLTPALQQAAKQVDAGEPVASLTGKVAASGGVVGLIFAVIVFLMVYKPGR